VELAELLGPVVADADRPHKALVVAVSYPGLERPVLEGDCVHAQNREGWVLVPARPCAGCACPLLCTRV